MRFCGVFFHVDCVELQGKKEVGKFDVAIVQLGFLFLNFP
jgi:hypothetical protein